MIRFVLELRCIKCSTKFERSFEERRRDSAYSEGGMVHLGISVCPNNCGGEWFAIEKQHQIRKFKRHY